ncbi:PucR family transcriptional regulator [Microbacterium sp. NPDC090007]|uniref:PucR family transcriptional regulator n=1 Tax=Microbacterium sp. NPDC090007 TaxID=3364204 RepID=UPI0037F9B328
MPASLRTLLDHDRARLRARTPLDGAVLDRPLSWVHSSDLLDPTPWLEPGNLLLTNGAPFAGTDAADPRAYAERLRAAGVAGLGFATDVIHAEVPPEVVEACAAAGLPLIEVGGRAPFIGIIRFVADLIAADRAARFTWLLDAQRSVARAAVRDDGLREILRTLSRLLDTWVALYDGAGARIPLEGIRSAPSGDEERVAAEMRRLLERATAASVQLPAPGGAVLQTIGRSGHLRGVLAVGARAAFDPAEKDLVATVVALASIALDQQRQVQTSLRSVRAGVIELLVDGHVDAAGRLAEAVFGALPPAPMTVVSLREASAEPGLLDELDVVMTDPRRLFFAARGGDVVVLAAEGEDAVVSSLVARRGLAAGSAARLDGDDLATALRRAGLAAREASAGTVRAYAEIAGSGLVGALRARGGDLIAASLLRPLEAVAPGERRRLLDSARAWLDANGAWDPAARGLGIHRHTLKARMAQLEQMLGIDLTSFAARAELWAALQLTH